MKHYTGFIIVSTFAFYLLSVVLPSIFILPVVLAWLVPLLTWRELGRNGVRQCAFLLLAGVVALCFSATKGVFLGWKQIFGVNVPLISMFVAVTFLTLTCKSSEDEPLPSGSKAVATTAIGTHLLGAVINLSVIFLFGDRLQRKGKLSQEQVMLLARSFCAGAWWSPFFIATGVALTYAPEMQWKETLVPGIIMSGIALGYTICEVIYVRKSEFSGYPLRRESLSVPIFLAVLVIGAHYLWHDTRVLNLICLLAPTGAYLFMKERPRVAVLKDFIQNRILSVRSQFALFLAAGVFSTGLKSITHVYPALFSFQGSTFTPFLFAAVLGGMILIGILGIHPVITIALVSPLLLPLNPDHSQLGFLFVTVWAVSTASSPILGVGLALTSRYAASPRQILTMNYHYALAMWGITSVLNILFFS